MTAVEQASIFQVKQDLLEELGRDVLSLSHVLDLNRPDHCCYASRGWLLSQS